MMRWQLFVEDKIKEHPQIMLTRVSPMSHQGADVDAKTTFGEILAKRAHLSTLQVHIALLDPHKLWSGPDQVHPPIVPPPIKLINKI